MTLNWLNILSTPRLHLLPWTKGIQVGQDARGNCYYQSKRGKHRRWVLYRGSADAAQISPSWHGWLHYTNDNIPQNTKDLCLPAKRVLKTKVKKTSYEAWSPPKQKEQK